MIKLRVPAAVAIFAATALISAGAGYLVSRVTMTAQVVSSCTTPGAVAAAPEPPQLMPNGPTVPVTKGKGW